ncbi:hypothetical protein HPB51_001887 [Rhipicephalus microplus]|uniref:Transmembrane protein n=1 Tax=Rhipicephalus microplus TaxID=6941 RepID=A0A9J6E6B4_RHIMP|nr:hypothetical protein HPB51_001887 [Rhipicephalus microplus]
MVLRSLSHQGAHVGHPSSRYRRRRPSRGGNVVAFRQFLGPLDCLNSVTVRCASPQSSSNRRRGPPVDAACCPSSGEHDLGTGQALVSFLLIVVTVTVACMLVVLLSRYSHDYHAGLRCPGASHHEENLAVSLQLEAPFEELEPCCPHESTSMVPLIAQAQQDESPLGSDRCIALLNVPGAMMALAIACALVFLIASLFSGLKAYLPRVTRMVAKSAAPVTKSPSLTWYGLYI